ncbi:MAG: 16S rRNA (adenine(1518)-N(6)/adenine(1519)-N(6))-dimethyltransferase RsmA [Rhodospirillales bacterium]|nr:16S rRNA (adenine(1518)-N(6)/adenine(1519)-N(6))-dimethyltransferase RsmA [Rhodospirillales bacterium]MCB9973938.1 16S rRNA (adenine(1518)-N(6)/adenine(1519)-N(6))-dimethyltransferase RsmA [Rhodospirillales bacterium]
MKAGDNSASVLPPLRDIIRDFGLRAEKSLGQNFILDQNLTDKIVRAAGGVSGLHVFEIGPGPGGLTRSILNAAPRHLSAIEYDFRAIAALESLRVANAEVLTLIQGDALTTDLLRLSPNETRAIIANLPYNIATPLLIGWLKQIRQSAESYQHMTLMFQREVAERIIARPKTKAYGRLSVMAQWLCQAHIVFDLPPTAFVPPPKVTSSVVHFRPAPLPADAPSFAVMEQITAAAFNQRRKMIRSSLKAYLPAVQAAGIDETNRAEDLVVAEYVTLAGIVQNTLNKD